MKLVSHENFLIVGGVIAGLDASWHLLMIIGGPNWYAFARAPQYIVGSAREGTFVAPLSAIAIAILMFTCALYSFSGSGLIRRIPLLKSALVIIALICLVRGTYISPLFFSLKALGTWHLIASAVWFFVGVCFLAGAINQFSNKKYFHKNIIKLLIVAVFQKNKHITTNEKPRASGV